MSPKPLFEGLVIDENDNPVSITQVGDEPCYVVDDAGFLRHIPTQDVDRQVLQIMFEMIQGSESLLSQQAAKMLGQEDIFTQAMIESQLKQLDKQFDTILNTGIPEEGRAYMGMMGFRVRINVHGEVVDVEQPGMIDPGEE